MHHVASTSSHLVLNLTLSAAPSTLIGEEERGHGGQHSDKLGFVPTFIQTNLMHILSIHTTYKNQTCASGLFQPRPTFLFGVRFEVTLAAPERLFYTVPTEVVHLMHETQSKLKHSFLFNFGLCRQWKPCFKE